MFWIETWWRRAHSAIQQWFLHQHGLFLSILNVFPPTKWLVAGTGAAALKTLVFKSRSVLQTFCSFPQFEETGAWLIFLNFPLFSSFCLVPVPDSLGCFIPVSVQLSYSLASSARVMKRHTRLLSGCSFQLIVCSWIVLLRKLFPRWTVCPFVASFKNTFGC